MLDLISAFCFGFLLLPLLFVVVVVEYLEVFMCRLFMTESNQTKLACLSMSNARDTDLVLHQKAWLP